MGKGTFLIKFKFFSHLKAPVEISTISVENDFKTTGTIVVTVMGIGSDKS